MKRTLLLLCCSALTLSSAVQGQVVNPADKRGPLSGVGSILTLEASTRPPSAPPGAIFFKQNGDQNQAPAPWPNQGAQIGNYSIEALFPKHHDVVEIDAISTGNAYIDSRKGEPQLSGQWAGVTLSVTNSAVGLPGNGWIDRRLSGQYPTRLTPGADLATHFFIGSEGIDDTLLGRTFVTQLAEHVGLNDVQDTDSLDVAMGVIASGTGQASELLFHNIGEVYFSLTPGSAGLLTNQRFALNSGGSSWVQPDPATIYRVRWDGASQKWGLPYEFLTPGELGLTRGDDDIDAVDVDVINGNVAYSTQPHPGRSQLRVYERDLLASYDMKSQGQLVTSQFYLREHTGGDEGDDVDAVCIFDPEQGLYDNLLGTAVPSASAHSLGLSVLFEADGSVFGGMYRCQVTGRVNVMGGSQSGSTGGIGQMTSQAVPRVKIYSSWDHIPGDPVPNNGTWTELEDGIYVGLATELRVSLPAHSYPSGKPVFFRAEVYHGSPGVLLEETWVSALDI